MEGSLLKLVVMIMNFLLLQDDKWSCSFDPKLQELITQLESGLQSVLQKGDRSVHKAEFSGNIAGEFVFCGVCVYIYIYICMCVCVRVCARGCRYVGFLSSELT
jgi:hypothetical protein